MKRLEGVAKHYHWGSPEAIPALLGRSPDGHPYAEWWLGTHHAGEATLADGRQLGDVAGSLPYLLKLLSAAEPLSLQTHPSTAQARAGFDAEELAGIALDDPTRTYRDRLAKPELLVALTPFVALCGFRPLDTSTALLAAIGADDLATRLTRDGLAATVAQLYHGEFAIGPTVARCAASPIAEARLVTQLATRYPADPSALVALLLNRLELRPGQSVYLTPGNLHAYVSGTAVEIMGDSDNVIRGGLTTKHVDVIALLDLLDYAPLSDPFVHPVAHGPHAVHYPTPGAPFALDRIDVPAGHTYESPATGRELWLVLGNRDPGCWYVAAGELGRVAGAATIYRARPAII